MKINRKNLRSLIESVINEETGHKHVSFSQRLIDLIQNPDVQMDKKERFVANLMKSSKVSQEEKRGIQQLLDAVKQVEEADKMIKDFEHSQVDDVIKDIFSNDPLNESAMSGLDLPVDINSDLEPISQNQKSLPEMVMDALRIGLPAGTYKCEMQEDPNGVASIECNDAMNDLVFVIQFQY